MEKTSSGMDEHVAAALAYALGWITGAVFLLTEPTNKFVRFHALQSLIVFGGLSLLWFITLSIPVLWLIALVLLPPVSLILWLFLMFKAYQGERFKVPFVGEFADQKER